MVLAWYTQVVKTPGGEAQLAVDTLSSTFIQRGVTSLPRLFFFFSSSFSHTFQLSMLPTNWQSRYCGYNLSSAYCDTWIVLCRAVYVLYAARATLRLQYLNLYSLARETGSFDWLPRKIEIILLDYWKMDIADYLGGGRGIFHTSFRATFILHFRNNYTISKSEVKYLISAEVLVSWWYSGLSTQTWLSANGTKWTRLPHGGSTVRLNEATILLHVNWHQSL